VGAKRLGSESSRGRTDEGAKRPVTNRRYFLVSVSVRVRRGFRVRARARLSARVTVRQ